jgi:hypothetical protein
MAQIRIAPLIRQNQGQNNLGRTPLHIGLERGYNDIVKDIVVLSPAFLSVRFLLGKLIFHLSCLTTTAFNRIHGSNGAH